jgi:hypothetical protein
LPKVEHVQVLATSRQDPIFDEKTVQLVASDRQLVEQTFNLLLATGNLLPETGNLLKQQATSCSYFQLVASNKQLVARQQVAFNKSTVWTGLYSPPECVFRQEMLVLSLAELVESIP